MIVPVSKDKAVTVNNSNNYHPAAPQKYVSLYVLKRVKLNKIFHQTSAGQFGLKSNLKIKSQKAQACYWFVTQNCCQSYMFLSTLKPDVNRRSICYIIKVFQNSRTKEKKQQTKRKAANKWKKRLQIKINDVANERNPINKNKCKSKLKKKIHVNKKVDYWGWFCLWEEEKTAGVQSGKLVKISV